MGIGGLRLAGLGDSGALVDAGVGAGAEASLRRRLRRAGGALRAGPGSGKLGTSLEPRKPLKSVSAAPTNDSQRKRMTRLKVPILLVVKLRAQTLLQLDDSREKTRPERTGVPVI